MKRFAFLIFGGCFAVAISSCSTTSPAAKKEANAAKEAALKTAIEQRQFVISVDRMNPMRGASQQLTSLYSLEIHGDSVKSYLPYFGQAYSVPYGGGSALNFNSTITDYKSSVDAKGKTTIDFKTKSEDDRYAYRIVIFSNASTSINVTSGNRQLISFDGTAESKR